MIGSNLQDKAGGLHSIAGATAATGPPSTTKHGKASARSVEKQGNALQRLNPHTSHHLNQTHQHVTNTMQTQMSIPKQSTMIMTGISSSSDHNNPSQTKNMKVSETVKANESLCIRRV